MPGEAVAESIQRPGVNPEVASATLIAILLKRRKLPRNESCSMNRLENLSAELAEQLRQASPDRQRAAGLAACNYAITHVPVGHPVLNQALQILNQGGSISPAMLRQLELLAANLDEEYFDLQAATDRGEATSDACTQKFAQARAVSAVGAAFDEDPFEASSNAIYEAAFVADDTAPLFQVIKATLS